VAGGGALPEIVRALRRDLIPNGEAMLAEQFIAAAGARNSTALDEIARLTWRAHAEGALADADTEALSEAIEARRAALAVKPVFRTQAATRAASGLPRSSRRREKVFGLGRPRALDRNAKVRIMHWARCLSRRTEKGKAYGVITAKALAVLEALLWAFHNGKSGLCFPSYEKIAEAAGCARSSISGALHALEACGVLSWVHRLKRVRERCSDLFGEGFRIVPARTSNGYWFNDPSPAGQPIPPKANFQSGTPNQGFFSSMGRAAKVARGDFRTTGATLELPPRTLQRLQPGLDGA
jgi:Helix-turn-helix domain